MTEQPSLSEVMRHVRDLVQQVRDLVGEVRSDYVRKDLWDARHNSLIHRVDELEKDATKLEKEVDERERERRAFQRQVVAGVLVGLVLMVAQIILVLTRIPGGS